MPDQKLPPLGRFEDWSDLIRNTLVWLEMACCETQRHLEDGDPVRDKLRTVLSAWHEAFGHTLMTPFRRPQLPPEHLRGAGLHTEDRQIPGSRGPPQNSLGSPIVEKYH